MKYLNKEYNKLEKLVARRNTLEEHARRMRMLHRRHNLYPSRWEQQTGRAAPGGATAGPSEREELGRKIGRVRGRLLHAMYEMGIITSWWRWRPEQIHSKVGHTRRKGSKHQRTQRLPATARENTA